MATEAERWLSTLFEDLNLLAPHGVTWSIDRPDPPLWLRVGLADGPTLDMELRNDRPLARISVVKRVQAHIDAGWDVPLPPCPAHGLGLGPVRRGARVDWRCPRGDAGCEVGSYADLLWPPSDPSDGLVPTLISQRLRRRGVAGVTRLGVRDGAVHVRLRRGGDSEAVRAVAHPLPVEIEWAPEVGWARTRDGDGERLSIWNGWMQLAGLSGRLVRRSDGGLGIGDVDLHLAFDHLVGGPGSPLLLDASGVAFADEGDEVTCGGGFRATSAVRGAPGVFVAGRITRRTGAGPSGAADRSGT